VLVSSPYVEIYASFYAVQYIPALASVCMLRNNSSKLYFSLFFVLWSGNVLPSDLLYRFSGDWSDCIDRSGLSGLDLSLYLSIPALLSLLWAIRREFTKFKEECVWRTVTRIQDSFEYPV
jgi:hypothetical protein